MTGKERFKFRRDNLIGAVCEARLNSARRDSTARLAKNGATRKEETFSRFWFGFPLTSLFLLYIPYPMRYWNARIMSVTLWETSKMKQATFMKSMPIWF